MKFSHKMLLSALLISASAPSWAFERITGAEAERRYVELGEERGPYCTGLCIPNEPCDPPCFTLREGEGISCTKTEYLKSKRVEYTCEIQ